MRPQDIDSRGNVALLDTVTDEIKHRPVNLAQEILMRNPAKDGEEPRYRVMERDTPESMADPEKRRLQIVQERGLQSDGGSIIHGDATDLVSGRHSAPVAKPSADTPPAAAERAGDPDKMKAQRERDVETVAENVKVNERATR